ncbi:MAG: hypothetical protein ACYTBZ_06010 [Planctomycetota bacterium]
MSFTTSPSPFDLDQDSDVDQEDFGIFQACYSGNGINYEEGCENSDYDDDGDVDHEDFNLFQSCMAGANNPPECL